MQPEGSSIDDIRFLDFCAGVNVLAGVNELNIKNETLFFPDTHTKISTGEFAFLLYKCSMWLFPPLFFFSFMAENVQRWHRNVALVPWLIWNDRKLKKKNQNSCIQIHFMYGTIYPFKVYNLMTFSICIFTELCIRHKYQLQSIFIIPERNPIFLRHHAPISPSPPALGNH